MEPTFKMSNFARSVSQSAATSQRSPPITVHGRRKKISDPIPSYQSSEHFQKQYQPYPSSSDHHINSNYSNEYSSSKTLHPAMPESLTRKSSAVSTIPSNTSDQQAEPVTLQEKDVGFRATVRRMLGSQKRKSNPHKSKLQRHSSHHKPDSTNDHSLKTGQFRHRAVASTGALSSHPMAELVTSIPRTPSVPVPSPYQRRNTLPNLFLQDNDAHLLPLPLKSPRSIDSGKSLRSPVREQRMINRRSRSADAMVKLMNQASPRTGTYFRKTDTVESERMSAMRETASTSKDLQTFLDIPNPTTFTASKSDPTQSLQAFDFGLDHGRSLKTTSVEQRINVIEVKLKDFEYALAKLQDDNRSLPKEINEAITPVIYVDGGSSPSSMTTSSTKNTSSSSSPSRAIADRVPTPHPRYSSGVTTIKSDTRGEDEHISESPLPSSLMLVLNQTEQLLQLLEEERIARQQMELHIMELQREVEMLRDPIYASIRQHDYSDWDRQSRTLHRSAPFESKRPTERTYETSRFSMTDSEADTEDNLTEVYATPKERYIPFEQQRGRSGITMVQY